MTNSSSNARSSNGLWQTKGFLVSAFVIAVLALLLLGGFIWTSAQLRMAKGGLETAEQRHTVLTQRLEHMARLAATDSLVVVDGTYGIALEQYRALLADAPEDLREAIEVRIAEIEGMLADSAEQPNGEMQDLLIGRYRNTIAELETQLVRSDTDRKRWADSTLQVVADLRADLARKQQEVGSRDKVQVISFNSPKGHKIHYLGEVENGKANGGGVGIWATGSVYRGNWRNNLRHGQGTFEWADGERYEGNYVNGIREGQGTYHWPSGDRYEGQWTNDRRNGEGVLFDMDGNERFRGQWKDDKPLDK